mmetsp:Transcript_19470/g.57450  ORF Transcript_19470/g.57450 Transcript_19470/m.57450 type:complete len:221 (+) Transcript_19470:395-1057(+)
MSMVRTPATSLSSRSPCRGVSGPTIPMVCSPGSWPRFICDTPFASTQNGCRRRCHARASQCASFVTRRSSDISSWTLCDPPGPRTRRVCLNSWSATSPSASSRVASTRHASRAGASTGRTFSRRKASSSSHCATATHSTRVTFSARRTPTITRRASPSFGPGWQISTCPPSSLSGASSFRRCQSATWVCTSSLASRSCFQRSLTQRMKTWTSITPSTSRR